ncbi:MAG: prepilin-type N-terminal cleavage/methylation domain-containing protein [Meiothermus sp.]|nr:MAG: prepilin-type N-terminal cleavage/methylation domain-containing protein [Meiothermus sp.]
MRKYGVTLVELLVALAILGVLVAAFTGFFVSTLRATSDFDRRNELLLDGQIAHQLLVSRLQEAWFVYPAGQSIVLSGPAAWQTTNPASGSNVWTVGDQFVAVVLPPLRVGSVCSPATPGQTEGCYRFFAYYPLSRAAYVANSSGIFDRLPPDAANPDAWVLMQYTGFLEPSTVVSGSAAPTGGALGALGGTSVALVADYLAPRRSFFSITEVAAGPPAIRQVSVSLQFSRVVQGRTLSVGGAGTSLSATVQPRNQGVLAP